jgi:hypothetical protein
MLAWKLAQAPLLLHAPGLSVCQRTQVAWSEAFICLLNSKNASKLAIRLARHQNSTVASR